MATTASLLIAEADAGELAPVRARLLAAGARVEVVEDPAAMAGQDGRHAVLRTRSSLLHGRSATAKSTAPAPASVLAVGDPTASRADRAFTAPC